MVGLWRWGVMTGLVLMATPWLVVRVSGSYAWVGVGGTLLLVGTVVASRGGLAWMHHRDAFHDTMRQDPWQALPWLLPGLWVTGHFLLAQGQSVRIFLLSWGALATLGVPVLLWLGLRLWRSKKGDRSRFWRGWWLGGMLVLLGRFLLGPKGGKGLELEPVVMGLWGLLWLMPPLALRWRAPGPLVALAWLGVALHLANVEFYVQPLPHQRRWVSSQPGVRLVLTHPYGDFRWLVQGCGPGEYWAGARVFTPVHRRLTLWRQNDEGLKGWRRGFATSDNGATHCPLRLVAAADNGPGGLVHLLSQTNAAPLGHSPRRGPQGAFDMGFSGLAIDPKRGWLFAGMDRSQALLWMRIKDPTRPRTTFLPERATVMTTCLHSPNPCLASAFTGWLHWRGGEELDHLRSTPLPWRTLGPDIALDEKRRTIAVATVLGQMAFYRTGSLKLLKTTGGPTGLRYMLYWPRTGRFWAANFLDGWLYSFTLRQPPRREIFGGRRARWLNLTHDKKGLLWCAASACYEYRPKPRR